jgi:hypothetical protein
VAEPGWDHRAKAARGDHQKVVRRVKRGVFAVAAVAHHRAFADLGPFTAENPRPPVNEFGDIGFALTRRLQVFAQLAWDDDRVIARPDRIVPDVRAHFGGEGFEDFLRVPSSIRSTAGAARPPP